MQSQNRAFLYGLLAVLMWSTVATAFKLTLLVASPTQLLLGASLVSLFVLGGILALQGRLRLTLSCTRRQYRHSLMLGLLNPLAYYLMLIKAYDLLPAQEAQPINYTWALTLSLLSIPLLKQRIRPSQWAACLLGYSGVVVISTHGNPLAFRFSDPLGVALALGSTVIWALSWIYSAKDDRDPVVGLFLNFLFGLPFVIVACALSGDLRSPGWQGLLGAAYLGAFEMGFAFVFWLKALKLSENSAKVANLVFLSPFLSLVFIRFVLGETIRPSTYAGLIFIVAGLLLQGGSKSRSAG
jgi:drug/metabolite transporter (DMT)-like permease